MGRFIALVILGLLSGVRCQTYPGDAAGYAGDSVNITCRSSAAASAAWTHMAYGSADSEFIYVPTKSIIVNGYSVNDDVPFDLTIESVSENTAGQYGCSLMQGHDNMPDTERSAFVMLLDDMMCDEESSGDAENREIRFVCSIRVYGEVTPKLQWTREDEVLTSEELHVSDDDLANPYDWRTVSLTYATTAQSEFDNSEHTCRVYFDSASAPSVTPATFESTCTDVYRVTHTPTNLVITHDGVEVVSENTMEVHLGDSFNCTVSSFPASELTWVRIEGDGAETPEYTDNGENESQMWVDETMLNTENVYQCVATQGAHSEMDNVRFTVVGGSGTGGACGVTFNILLLTFTLILGLF